MTTDQTNCPESTTTTTDPVTAYDVTIIGGGVAGSAAGVFTARAEMETLIVENNRSTLGKCAHLENYLGFPDGIRPALFLEMARDHTNVAGCERVTGTVSHVEPTGEGEFIVEFGDMRVRTDYVLIASWADSEFLDGCDVETEPEEPGPVDVVPTDEEGRTDVAGLYAAGRLTKDHHQAIVNAGAGARVALTIINDVEPEFYNDWVVPEGYYEGYDREIPESVEEVSHEERRQRVRRSRETMRDYFAAEEEHD